jgi:hypothetical protein
MALMVVLAASLVMRNVLASGFIAASASVGDDLAAREGSVVGGDADVVATVRQHTP